MCTKLVGCPNIIWQGVILHMWTHTQGYMNTAKSQLPGHPGEGIWLSPFSLPCGKQCKPGWWSLRYGAHCSVALWREVSEKEQWPLPGSSIWEKDVPQLSFWCQTLHFFPICHWYLLSCCPSTGAQKEWVWVSSCVGPLRETAWESSSFFHWLNPLWFS